MSYWCTSIEDLRDVFRVIIFASILLALTYTIVRDNFVFEAKALVFLSVLLSLAIPFMHC